MKEACIERVGELLDDPIIADWALAYYEDRPDLSGEKTRLADLWFNESTIARWFDEDQTAILRKLFSCLPVERFAAFVPAIAERWGQWPESTAMVSVPILAAIAPELAGQTFAAFLEASAHPSTGRIEAILESLERLPRDAAHQLFGQIMELVTGANTTGGHSLCVPAFTAAVAIDERSVLPALFDRLFDGSKASVESGLRAVSSCLFGHTAFVDPFLAHREGYESPSFAELASLFERDAPLREMDEVLHGESPLAPAMQLLSRCHARRPEASLAWTIIEQGVTGRDKRQPECLAAFALAASACAFERQEFATSSLPLDDVLALLSLDVSTNPCSPRLTDRLHSFPRDQAHGAIARRLAETMGHQGAMHIVEAIAELGWAELTPSLVDCLCSDIDPYLCEAATRALISIGPPAGAALIAQWDALDASQRIYGAAVLATTGGPAVAEFALARADELLRDDLERWCSLALAEPDPRLLERLRPEMRRHQPVLDETFYCLCQVLSVEPTELEEVRGRVIKERQRRIAWTELLASDTPLRTPEGLYLPLRCRSCAAVNRYEVRAVAVGDLSTEDMLIADELSCLSCGKSGNLDFEPEARMTVAAKMLAQRAGGDWQRPGTAQVIIAERVRQPDGKLQTIPAYYAGLQQKVARNIEDWRSWFRLGKLQSHINRPTAALTSLRKAYAINPLCLEVVVGLAQELSEAGHQTEAFDVLDGAQAHSRRWQTLSGNMAEARGEFISLLDSLSRQLGVVQASSQTAGAHADRTKVGRNDPCPCGSGRKFKKCCMS